MLIRLRLEEFVIVTQLDLEFGPGLNVLTGETGAGKSLLVDALTLISGGRAEPEWVRPGAERLTVEGVFELEPAEAAVVEASGISLDEDRVLIVRREVQREGRSRAWLNGRAALVSDLRRATSGLLRLVAQQAAAGLEESAERDRLLDLAGQHLSLASEYRAARRAYLDAQALLTGLESACASFAAEEEWLRYQLAEIREVDPKPGERSLLLEELARARSVEARLEFRAELEARLFHDEGSVLDHLESLCQRIRGSGVVPALSDELLALRERVRELRVLVRSAEEGEGIDLAAIEARVARLDRLRKKHGPDEEAILVRADELGARIDAGGNAESACEGASRETEELRVALGRVGAELSRVRRASARDLARRANQELEALGLKGATLGFEFERELSEDGVPVGSETVHPGEDGIERNLLRFRAHPSAAYGDLLRVASGGELSRVLLALQVAIGAHAAPGAWIFDEIDAGLGGEAALRVGDRLAHLAADRQVLLVTHQAAIAARADRHLCVEKYEVEGRPAVRVQILSGDARRDELARMLAGDRESSVARRHARELLREARTEEERPS